MGQAVPVPLERRRPPALLGPAARSSPWPWCWRSPSFSGHGASGASPRATSRSLLCVLNPDVLAHGHLVTNDLPVVLFVFLSVVAFERLVERVTVARVVAVALAVGAAFATKFSAFALPADPARALRGGRAAAGAARRRHRADHARSEAAASKLAVLVAVLVVVVGVLALGVVWAAYGFQSALDSGPRGGRVHARERRAGGQARPSASGPALTRGTAAARGVGVGLPELLQVVREPALVPARRIFRHGLVVLLPRRHRAQGAASAARARGRGGRAGLDPARPRAARSGSSGCPPRCSSPSP